MSEDRKAREAAEGAGAAPQIALQDNLREAWSALSMIRETVETLGPIGCMASSEHLEGPTFTHEADEIVKGIRAIVSRFDVQCADLGIKCSRSYAAGLADMAKAAPQKPAPDAVRTRAQCDWPQDQVFTFRDDPGEHDPCYVVMPGGATLVLNHHAAEGVDIARAKFIVQACNAILSAAPVPPADGATVTQETLYQFLDKHTSLSEATNRHLCKVAGELGWFSPSPAGAAEPVAWPDHPGATVDAVALVEADKRYPQVDCDSVTDLSFADKQADRLGAFIDGFKRAISMLALPPVRGGQDGG